MDKKYGACQRCKTLGTLTRIGTLDPSTMKPAVMNLCPACEKLFLHVSRADRRAAEKTLKRLGKHGLPTGPRGKRQLPPRPEHDEHRKSPIEVARSPIIVPGKEENNERPLAGPLARPA